MALTLIDFQIFALRRVHRFYLLQSDWSYLWVFVKLPVKLPWLANDFQSIIWPFSSFLVSLMVLDARSTQRGTMRWIKWVLSQEVFVPRIASIRRSNHSSDLLFRNNILISIVLWISPLLTYFLFLFWVL